MDKKAIMAFGISVVAVMVGNFAYEKLMKKGA